MNYPANFSPAAFDRFYASPADMPAMDALAVDAFYTQQKDIHARIERLLEDMKKLADAHGDAVNALTNNGFSEDDLRVDFPPCDGLCEAVAHIESEDPRAAA